MYVTAALGSSDAFGGVNKLKEKKQFCCSTFATRLFSLKKGINNEKCVTETPGSSYAFFGVIILEDTNTTMIF